MSGTDRLEAIKARRAGITAYPWQADGDAAKDYDWQITTAPQDSRYPDHRPALVGEIGREDAEFIAHAPDDIDWLIGEATRLRGRLAELEWASARKWVVGPGFCPACHGYRTHGHEPDCWLAAELSK